MTGLNKNFTELCIAHGLEILQENPSLLEDRDELHHNLFNDDYFVIGYFNASNILKDCDYSPFEAIADLVELQEEQFGESNLKAININSEYVVNQLSYFYGYECIDEIIERFEETDE
jgi:hypothetical protein